MILELSQYNSKQVIGNGEWVNNFSPITLNTGDTVSVSQAFIDAQLSGDYNNIAIQEDTTLSLSFGMYYMNLQDGATTYSKPPAGTPFELYVLRYGNDPKKALYIQTKTVSLTKGNYSPNELAEEITRQLTRIGAMSLNEYYDSPNQFLKPSTFSASFKCKDFTSPPTTGNYPLTKLTFAINPIPDEIFALFPVGAQININMMNEYNVKYSFTSAITGIDKTTSIVEFNAVNVLPGNRYEDVSIVSAAATNIHFYNQNDSNDSLAFTSTRFVGTSQVALEYDVNQNGKFQWTYLHLPMYDDSTKAEGIFIIEDANKLLRFADTRSGIFWTDLQPRAFWSNLGFDLNSLIVRDNVGQQSGLLTKLSRGENITAGYVGLDAFIANSRSLPVPPDLKDYFYATTQSVSIVASNNYTGTDGGFYILEVLGLQTDYQDDVKSYSAIMSVSSKNYDQNGFITVYTDGSLIFTNNGEPRTISTLQVRILDPLTKDISPLLGSRNSVFLNIQKAQP